MCVSVFQSSEIPPYGVGKVSVAVVKNQLLHIKYMCTVSVYVHEYEVVTVLRLPFVCTVLIGVLLVSYFAL